MKIENTMILQCEKADKWQRNAMISVEALQYQDPIARPAAFNEDRQKLQQS